MKSPRYLYNSMLLDMPIVDVSQLNPVTLKALLFFTSFVASLFGDINSPDREKVPVFKVNFYLMGIEELDREIPLQIGKNIEYLNQEYEGRVKFKLNELFMNANHSYIPDLHQDHIKKDLRRVKHLIEPIEKEGTINIYIFDTYSTNEGYSAMLGFTPVLSGQFKKYKSISPQFDRLFISYAGLQDRSTIVHEMGHFLGLKHPWEMTGIDLDLMGFLEEGSERNHMTYHPEVNHFSSQQLDRMQHFALTFRSYLLHDVETRYVSDKAFVKARRPNNGFH